MSGGYFDYDEFHITQIADQIERVIVNNTKQDEYGFAFNYSKDTLSILEYAVQQLKRVATMIHRIDWLLSGDDGEKTFTEKWSKDNVNILMQDGEETFTEKWSTDNVNIPMQDLSPEIKDLVQKNFWKLAIDKPNKVSPDYEIFIDPSYYDLLCVRNKNDKRFDSPTSFHFINYEDAKKFFELISMAK